MDKLLASRFAIFHGLNFKINPFDFEDSVSDEIKSDSELDAILKEIFSVDP